MKTQQAAFFKCNPLRSKNSYFALILIVLTVVVLSVQGRQQLAGAYGIPGLGSISGTVTDFWGRPVEGMNVTAYNRDSSMYSYSSLTDKNGQFSVIGLPAGEYILEYNANCGNVGAYYYDNQTDWYSADPVVVGDAADVTGIDITLRSDISGAISGHVSDASGNPVPDAAINTMWCNGVKSDANGNYRLGGLTSGSYRVKFSSPDYASQYYNNETDVALADLVPVTASAYEYGGAATTQYINAVLTSGGSISGVVTDEYGQPLQFVSVKAERPGSDPCTYGLCETAHEVSTDATGHFTINHLAAGDYIVSLNIWNHTFYYNDKVDAQHADPVSVQDGSDTQISASLSHVALGTITGTVTDSAGNPLPNLNGWIEGDRGTGWSHYAVSTNESGSYSVSVPAGNYYLWFLVWGRQYFYGSTSGWYSNPIAVTEGATVHADMTVTAPGTASVSGTVTDATGRPLSFVIVWTGDEGHNYSDYTYTDINGYYVFSGLPAGDYYISFNDWNRWYFYGTDEVSWYARAGGEPVHVADGATISGKDATLTPPGVNGVNCDGTRPDLRLSLGNPYWFSYGDYQARLLTVMYTIADAGSVPAYNVAITGTSNTNGVTMNTSLPDVIWPWIARDMYEGTGRLVYHVPEGVAVFQSSLHGRAEDFCGSQFTYSPG